MEISDLHFAPFKKNPVVKRILTGVPPIMDAEQFESEGCLDDLQYILRKDEAASGRRLPVAHIDAVRLAEHAYQKGWVNAHQIVSAFLDSTIRLTYRLADQGTQAPDLLLIKEAGALLLQFTTAAAKDETGEFIPALGLNKQPVIENTARMAFAAAVLADQPHYASKSLVVNGDSAVLRPLNQNPILASLNNHVLTTMRVTPALRGLIQAL